MLTTFSDQCGVTYCKVLATTISEDSSMALKKHDGTFEARFDGSRPSIMSPALRKRKRDDGTVDDILKFRRVRLRAWNFLSDIAASQNFHDQLSRFHKNQDIHPYRFLEAPGGWPLDLYRLKKAVEVRGGFEKVCKLEKWPEIESEVRFGGIVVSGLGLFLKNSYEKWILPYEEFLGHAELSVQDQIGYKKSARHDARSRAGKRRRGRRPTKTGRL